MYPCSQGLGRFDSLMSVMMMTDQEHLKSKIKDSFKLTEDEATMSQYTVCVGNRLWNL